MLRSLGWRLNQWAELLVESPCPLCQRSTPQPFCVDCERQLQHCRIASPAWELQDLPVFAWGRYGGSLKRAIAAMKFESQPFLAQPLGDGMATAWIAANQPQTGLTVVPIPLHRQKLQTRGFNQAEWLAKRFCAQTGLPLASQGLERVRETQAQFQVAGRDRHQNLQGAFAIGPAFVRRAPQTPVLLLDDIYTTGATAQAATQTLRQQGIRVAGIVVLAIAQRDSQT